MSVIFISNFNYLGLCTCLLKYGCMQMFCAKKCCKNTSCYHQIKSFPAFFTKAHFPKIRLTYGTLQLRLWTSGYVGHWGPCSSSIHFCWSSDEQPPTVCSHTSLCCHQSIFLSVFVRLVTLDHSQHRGFFLIIDLSFCRCAPTIQLSLLYLLDSVMLSFCFIANNLLNLFFQ